MMAEVIENKEGLKVPESISTDDAPFEIPLGLMCANVDCEKPMGHKALYRTDVMIRRGAPKFRVHVCFSCYKVLSVSSYQKKES
jgi:hypothetical protein